MQIQENQSPQTSPRTSESGSIPSPQTPQSPGTKSAGEVKNKLMHVSDEVRVGSPDLGVAEGQEAAEALQGGSLRISLENDVGQDKQTS